MKKYSSWRKKIFSPPPPPGWDLGLLENDRRDARCKSLRIACCRGKRLTLDEQLCWTSDTSYCYES